MKAEIKGLKEALGKMEQVPRDLRGSGMVEAMRDATMVVTRAARINAPVDTGRLRASITPEVVRQSNVVRGIVGSNVKYTPYMELGTRPHWPPIAALEVWARRHHTTAFLVARAIARRGIKARRFLQRALMENRNKIGEIISRTVGRIVEKRE